MIYLSDQLQLVVLPKKALNVYNIRRVCILDYALNWNDSSKENIISW